MDRALIPRFLPENYRLAAARPASPLAAMLAVMEGLHAPAEAVIDHLDDFVSPNRAPDPFVLLLGSWLGLDRYFDWSGDRPGKGAPRFRTGTARLRLLVAEAAALDRERGTRDTLRRILEIATGAKGFEIDEGAPDGRARPFHFTVRAPAAARPLADFVARIVEGERPAHASYSIVFQEMEQIPDKE
jgi:phage tail-like protein